MLPGHLVELEVRQGAVAADIGERVGDLGVVAEEDAVAGNVVGGELEVGAFGCVGVPAVVDEHVDRGALAR